METGLSTVGRRMTFAGVIAVATGAALFAACGDGGGEESLVTTKVPADVLRVSLSEWAVTAENQTVEEGVIQFSVDNRGVEVHEFVLVKDGEELGEIEGLLPGHLETIRFELKPGKYELACLIKETEPNGEVEDHYALGMHTAFEVR